ncbi:MAG: hypothetical protein KKB50_00650 [Planctomycetes bacterium]|nr:hypothetical protein [Planctomycetota bacterium]
MIAFAAVADNACLALAAQYFRLVIGSRGRVLLLAGVLGAISGHLVFGAVRETYALRGEQHHLRSGTS